MKKITKLLLGSLAMASIGGALASCNGGGGGGIQCLKITHYPGGYGTDYLDKFCKEFLAEKYGTTPDQIIAGKHYKLTGDSSITYGAEPYLKSKTNCPDIIMANGLAATTVTNNLVADLSDVYDSEVTKLNGDKIKISDYIMPEIKEQFSYQFRYGQGDRLPYALPWSAIPLSLAYNETVLLDIEHVSSPYPVQAGAIDESTGKWVVAPRTVNELMAFFNDVNEYNTKYSKKIVPFGWAMDGTNWFDALFTTWWAEVQGVDSSNVPGEGSFYDFFNFPSADVYKQTGLQTSLQIVKNLITGVDGEGKPAFVNCVDHISESTIKEVQTDFAKGEIAICLCGDFFENEYRDVIAQYGQTFKVMGIPTVSDSLSAQRNVALTTSSCMYVAKNSNNIVLAKDFLRYLCEEKNNVYFTESVGGIRPFDYNVFELDPEYTCSTFRRTTLERYYNADDYLLKFPRNVDPYDISPIYTYKGVQNNLFYGFDYGSVLSYLRTDTPQQIMIDGTANYNSVYANASKDFATWFKLYGLN